MNERTHFFIKIYLSYFIFERVDAGCVWDVRWRRGQTDTYWPKVLLTIVPLLLHLGWGCSIVGHWGLQALSLQADSHAGIFTPTDSDSNSNWLTQAVCGPRLYNWLESSCFRCSSAYLHSASLDWLLGRRSIYNTGKC